MQTFDILLIDSFTPKSCSLLLDNSLHDSYVPINSPFLKILISLPSLCFILILGLFFVYLKTNPLYWFLVLLHTLLISQAYKNTPNNFFHFNYLFLLTCFSLNLYNYNTILLYVCQQVFKINFNPDTYIIFRLF